MAVVADEVAEGQELGSGPRRVPLAEIRLPRPPRTGDVHRLDPRERVTQLVPERGQVVLPGLHPHQQAVERRHLDARRVAPRLERLHERRPRACERVENVTARLEVPLEQHLDELRDELAVVGMQPVHVLRPHALGQRRAPTTRARGPASAYSSSCETATLVRFATDRAGPSTHGSVLATVLRQAPVARRVPGAPSPSGRPRRLPPPRASRPRTDRRRRRRRRRRGLRRLRAARGRAARGGRRAGRDRRSSRGRRRRRPAAPTPRPSARGRSNT